MVFKRKMKARMGIGETASDLGSGDCGVFTYFVQRRPKAAQSRRDEAVRAQLDQNGIRQSCAGRKALTSGRPFVVGAFVR